MQPTLSGSTALGQGLAMYPVRSVFRGASQVAVTAPLEVGTKAPGPCETR